MAGYEHDHITLCLRVNLDQVGVQVFTPEIDVIVVVVEERHAMALEEPRDHFNIRAVLTRERQSDFVA